jgi:Tol biopolymer transport system component
MMIAAGTKLGPYEVTGAIGAGGMGEVYRARDSKLDRNVAIKVLPEAFARDAERMARFQREAKVLASLNHPNIATIHGLEDSGDTHALVMELVEGPTLADRIKSGPIPIDEALPIAKQICDALEYAHERGIIHRDLKPANVKVTNDDAVKVLDFGLAKALEGDPSSFDISTSPTISRMATMQGVLLGTAAYMSPEQAKAKTVDRRADIWAFGCVLYEMLTGKQAFTGETVTDTLASIIKEEPDLANLPAATQMRVRVLLQRCLQKDPKQRLRDIGDARISLDETLSGAPEATPGFAARMPVWRRLLPWALFGTTAITSAVFAWAPWRTVTTPAHAELIRFQISLPEKVNMVVTGAFALSPDGRQLAFAATGSDGVQRLWVRSLDSLEARPLLGSESTGALPLFIWSPDSRFIAFETSGKLKKIAISGGPAESICNLSGDAVGGSWNRDGVIIFGQVGGGLMRVSAGGGSASALTTLDPSRKELRHAFPSFLPDGRRFIYLRSGTAENSGIYAASLDGSRQEQNLKLLVATTFGAAYVPSGDPDLGQLLYVRDGALMAQSFDARRMELAGDAVTLAEGIGTYLSFGFFSASTSGALVYRTSGGNAQQQLTWYDGQGKALRTAAAPGDLVRNINLSPDGVHAAVSFYGIGGQSVVWLLDFSRGTSTRFTFGSCVATAAVWSPDGSRIIFASSREGNLDLYQKLASGARDEELLLQSSENKYPTSCSRDGRFLLYYAIDPKSKADLWVLPLSGDKKPFPFLRTEFNEQYGRFSPDGRWVAYSSDESGRDEIYVRSFSPDSGGTASVAGGKWLISNDGGTLPRWRGDGRELYYLAPDGKLMSVEISANPVFQAGVPRVLFQMPPTVSATSPRWDVTADGKRFILPAPTAQSTQAPFTVVLNWQSALKK